MFVDKLPRYHNKQVKTVLSTFSFLRRTMMPLIYYSTTFQHHEIAGGGGGVSTHLQW